MQVNIKHSFEKDIEKIQDKELLIRLLKTIDKLENSKSLKDIPNLKKLKGNMPNYRIKIGEYRIGINISNNIIYLTRFLHRKEIYRYFPK